MFDLAAADAVVLGARNAPALFLFHASRDLFCKVNANPFRRPIAIPNSPG
jgi:hypothetical protein